MEQGKVTDLLVRTPSCWSDVRFIASSGCNRTAISTLKATAMRPLLLDWFPDNSLNRGHVMFEPIQSWPCANRTSLNAATAGSDFLRLRPTVSR